MLWCCDASESPHFEPSNLTWRALFTWELVQEVEEQMHLLESGNYKEGEIPDLWDGKTTERILDIIDKEIFKSFL